MAFHLFQSLSEWTHSKLPVRISKKLTGDMNVCNQEPSAWQFNLFAGVWSGGSDKERDRPWM